MRSSSVSASATPMLCDEVVSDEAKHAVGGSKRTMCLCRARRSLGFGCAMLICVAERANGFSRRSGVYGSGLWKIDEKGLRGVRVRKCYKESDSYGGHA